MLEGDIAERDRLLDHFRTKLGSQESENLALRQEIASLKKAFSTAAGIPSISPLLMLRLFILHLRLISLRL